MNFFAELQALDCGLYLHREAVDSSTPSGMAMLQMCGVFAQYEPSMIRERVLAGLSRARAQGKTLGRPRTAAAVERTIRRMLAEGCGVRATARATGCSTSVVQRLLQAERPAADQPTGKAL